MMAASKLAGCSAGGDGVRGEGLPFHIYHGVRTLRSLPRPADIFDQSDWAGVIVDAERLVADGWAEQALFLGWAPVELFGVGPQFDGLACWLCGRRVLLLTNEGALTTDYNGGRSFYRRVDPAGLILLWEWKPQ